MSRRTATWLAWSLATLSLLVCVAAIGLYLATLPVVLQTRSSWGTGGLSAVFYVYLPFLALALWSPLDAPTTP